MSLVSLAIEKKTVTYFSTFLIVAAGILSYFQLGQLEDPEFTVKTASITTSYPGASPEEVELEVTDLIETKLQEMEEIKNMYSLSRAGQSIIMVDIKDTYWSDRLPQVWDVMRKKIRDIKDNLPPGAGKPQIGDDFGYVFGFLLAMTGEGFSYAEMEKYAKDLRKELILVEGVARVDFWGAQEKRIYLDVSQAQLSTLGLTGETIQSTLQLQNMVVDAGRVDLQTERFRIAPTGAFESPEDIANLTIRPTLLDTIQNLAPGGTLKPSSELIQVRDFATVSRGYIEPPINLMRFNGKPAIGIALAPLPGVNAVQVGRAVDKRLQEVAPDFPVGIEVEKISWQSDMVSESIQSFMINLIEAVLIVLVVLALTMGIRMGLIIGVSGLVFPILATFIVMAIMKIDLQRVSLGALIIAMGMMVDNAIVIADGIMVRLQKGMDRTQAAIESANQPAMPLLGATVVACMAFYPIFASPFSTGEYARSLFIVVAISLLFSWVLSQTVTPLMCIAMIPDPRQQGDGEDVYGGRFYQVFRGFLVKAIRYRVLFLGGMIALLIAAILGFGSVKQMFFPDASRLQFMIDYWLPEGTRIQEVSADFKDIEKKLMEDTLVESVSSFIGGGPPRFYLPVDPEMPYQSYGQLIVNTRTLKDVDAVMEEIDPWLKENKAYALTRVRKYGVGSFDDWKIEARFSGPAEADPDILRALAEKGKAILKESPWAKEVRSDWRQRDRKIVPAYSQERGRWAGVSRDDVARTTKRAYDGLPVGLFREGDDLIPIVLRHQEDERQTAATSLETLQVVPALSTKAVPLSQVATDIDVVWEDPIIWRWDRRRAITVQCSTDGVSADALRDSVLADFEAIELPPGYTLEWDGEYDSKRESMSGLIPGLVPGFVIIVFIIVLLFNAFRPPLIIFLVIPFAIIGITAGLLGTGTAFGFMALLGAMSLSGMMIKNAVVLLDQVNLEQEAGKSPYRAVIDAAICRLRPVVNAAATTIFGMAPLLQDIFWVSMAVTIMFGLFFGTILTMVVVPVLYAAFFRIKEEKLR
jgi:multidrug efflux pump subunit AcrB